MRSDLDSQMEGGKILTNDGDTLNLVYVTRVTDPAQFNAAFVEAFARKLAWHMWAEITQSNQKKADVLKEYTAIIAEAPTLLSHIR